MARAKWALHVDIFEPEGVGTDYPVVRHIFYGKTKNEANGYFDAHMGTCTFLSGCVNDDWFDTFPCHAYYRWERLSAAQQRDLRAPMAA